MLIAENVTYRIGSKTLLDGVTAEFAPGRLNLIVGPNGAGKSTLVKLLARLTPPVSGRVLYDGEDVAKASEADLAVRRAVLSQAVEIAFPLSVREVVMMGRYPHFRGRPSRFDEDAVDELMALFEVTEFGDRNYQTLSGGERQRVNFARVLAQLRRPADASGRRYLFLDEPLTFLDIRHQIDFMRKIREFASADDAVTIGVVHDLSLAARFADHIVMIDNARLVAAGTPAETLTPELLRQVFGVEAIPVKLDGHGVHLVFE